MTISSALETIPQPPSVSILGNTLHLHKHNPVQSLIRLAREYGPIYTLELFGRKSSPG